MRRDSSILPRSSRFRKMFRAGGQVPRHTVAPASTSALAMAKPKPPSSATPATNARLPRRSIVSIVVRPWCAGFPSHRRESSPVARQRRAILLSVMAESSPLLGRVIAGKFRIERLLGAGAMGEVYVAEQTSIGKRVAIKVLHKHLTGEAGIAKRFHREARAASILEHPNCIQIIDFG